MNATEAARLLARAAAFDSRKPSTAAAVAWAAALADIPMDGDALAAVARYYGAVDGGTDQRWIQPHNVRAIRAQIRADRLGPAGPGQLPAPPPADPDNPAAYMRALREQHRAIADGHQPRPAAAAIQAGGPVEPDLDTNPVVARLRAELDQRQRQARARAARIREQEAEQLNAYRAAVDVLLRLDDHGEAATAAAREELLGDAQAALGFPILAGAPGLTTDHKITIYAARIAEEVTGP